MKYQCTCCGSKIPEYADVVGAGMLRMMPRRVPDKYQSRELAEEAIAILHTLGWTPPDRDDHEARRLLVDAADAYRKWMP